MGLGELLGLGKNFDQSGDQVCLDILCIWLGWFGCICLAAHEIAGMTSGKMIGDTIGLFTYVFKLWDIVLI